MSHRSATDGYGHRLVSIAAQNLAQCGDADVLSAERMFVTAVAEMTAGIESCQLGLREVGDAPASAGGPFEGRVVVNDDDAILREVDVELEPIGAQREPVIECLDRILGPKRGTAAMCVNDGHARILCWFGERST